MGGGQVGFVIIQGRRCKQCQRSLRRSGEVSWNGEQVRGPDVETQSVYSGITFRNSSAPMEEDRSASNARPS
jgi:hypothetical protein